MKICPECDKNKYDETKYLFCFDCSRKEKEKREKEKAITFKGIPELIEENHKNTSALINQLEKNNNNLYRLIRQNDVILRKNHKTKIVWEKTKKDFIERKVK